MTRTTWILVLSLILTAGVAAYEFAYIQHLEFLINVLLSGTAN